MTESEKPSIQAKEKRETGGSAERTRPGPTFTPAADIFETDDAIKLLADLPGVAAKDLDVDLRESVLTLSGDVGGPEGEDEVEVLREYQTGTYFRQFTLSEAIDQSKINAELKNGVLRLTLQKIEKQAPRKIDVKAG
jgi:HSP20 family molecular chaperone IbpA